MPFMVKVQRGKWVTQSGGITGQKKDAGRFFTSEATLAAWKKAAGMLIARGETPIYTRINAKDANAPTTKKNPVPKSTRAKMADATALYERFTGHNGAMVNESYHPQGGTGAQFGKLDFLEVKKGAKTFALDFMVDGARRPRLGASFDGKQLFIADPPVWDSDLLELGVDIGTVIAIGYTTKREGQTEKYRHDFKAGSRPKLKRQQGYLLLTGGKYRFKDTGINDE